MRRLLLTIFLFVSSSVYASEMVIEYKRFYSHLNKLDSETMPSLIYTFGLLAQQPTQFSCQINSAYIHTQKVDLPLQINAFGRFSLPLEKALKLAGATIHLDIEGSEQVCDMSMSVEVDPQLLTVRPTQQQLNVWHSEFNVFFDEVGGMLAFMLPSVSGLVLHYAEPVRLAVMQSAASQHDNQLSLPATLFATFAQQNVQQIPYRVTALMAK